MSKWQKWQDCPNAIFYQTQLWSLPCLHHSATPCWGTWLVGLVNIFAWIPLSPNLKLTPWFHEVAILICQNWYMDFSKGGCQKLLSGFFPLRGRGTPPNSAKGFWAEEFSSTWLEPTIPEVPPSGSRLAGTRPRRWRRPRNYWFCCLSQFTPCKLSKSGGILYFRVW